MVYNAVDAGVRCWFAAFKRQQDWKLYATKGISRENVEELLTTAF